MNQTDKSSAEVRCRAAGIAGADAFLVARDAGADVDAAEVAGRVAAEAAAEAAAEMA